MWQVQIQQMSGGWTPVFTGTYEECQKEWHNQPYSLISVGSVRIREKDRKPRKSCTLCHGKGTRTFSAYRDTDDVTVRCECLDD